MMICYFIPVFYLNALLIYFALYFLTEAFIKFIKINSPSWQLFLRSLPLCKLLIEPFQYQFANWAFAQNTSFFYQPLNTRELQLGAFASLKKLGFWFSLNLKETSIKYTLLDPLFEKLGVWFVVLTFSLIAFVILFKCAQWLDSFIREIQSQEKIAQEYPIHNLPWVLQKKLNTKNVKIFISQRENFSPYVFFLKQKKIILPKNCLQILSKDELYAVIAHELAHLNQPLLYLFIFFHFMHNIFFFTQLKQIRFTLEKWCDKKAIKNGAAPHALMRAMQKFASNNLKLKSSMPHFVGSTKLIHRIQALCLAKKITKSQLLIAFIVTVFLTVVTFFSSIGHF